MTRYSRQTVLPEIGVEGQQALQSARILCIGAGGLGSPALLYLAAAGLGHIGIAEFDTVDITNLQRQILFSTDSVGEHKAVQAKKQLQSLNPEIEIKIYEDGLNADNALDLFQSYDVILDGTDNFETKYLINDAAVKYGKPWVYGAIQGFDGHASVFDALRGPCYRCLYPEPPKARIANCAEAGVIGAVAGLIGVTQALQVIQLVADHESFEPLIGKLWTLDTKTMQTRLLNIPKKLDCSVCSKKADEIVLIYQARACSVVQELTIQDLPNQKDAYLIDVRDTEEWQQGHIDGAQHWSLSKIMEGDLPNISRDAEIILHCQKGMRSIQAAETMQSSGFKKVYSLAGGYEAWLDENA